MARRDRCYRQAVTCSLQLQLALKSFEFGDTDERLIERNELSMEGLKLTG
jgi:hypothetical protein